MSLSPQDVPLLCQMFGKTPQVNFDNYDLSNEATFPELAPENYLERVLYDDVQKVESMPWACGLHNVGILNLIRIPYFGQYPIIGIFMRKLLDLVHEGSMWIQGRIPIDVALIHQITGLPKKGPHPMKGFGKSNELKV